jgi:hypothetical protein
MIPIKLSTTAQNAYHDLVRSLYRTEFAGTGGPAFLETRGTRRYWYERQRVGSSVKKRYLGEDNAETAAFLAERDSLRQNAEEARSHQSRLVRLLRAEGMTPTDTVSGPILFAMAKLGVFRLGGTIVGTQAFRLYEGELGLQFAFDQTTQTGDIDIAQFETLSLALGDQVEESLAKTFQDLEFAPVPSLKKSATWRWRQTKSDTLVEFLTPSFRPEEDIRPLPALGVSAQSLHFLNYLIAEPIKAAVLYRSGLLVQIPRPERYAIHKLIVANRRQAGPDAMKSRKDRLQAELIIRTMAEDRPGDLQDAYEDALSRGPRWQEHIAASLKLMPAVQSILHNL